MAQLTIADDEAQLAAVAADRIASLIRDACDARGRAFVCLTGGTTPEHTYEQLAGDEQNRSIDWTRVHLFWGDERHVPPDHPDSNYGMARRALLDRITIPPGQVHRIRAETPDARAAATEYERTLNTVASAVTRDDRVASAFRRNYFDIMLLGLGEDAHIASIFPGSELLERFASSRDVRLEADRSGDFSSVPPSVAAVWAPHLNAWRITLTPPAILDSRVIVMLVAGAGKADAVHAALAAPLNVAAYPAQLLRAAGDRMEWLMDRAAAARIR